MNWQSAHKPQRHRPGFTLLELVVGLFASSFVLLGLGGTLFLSVQANRTDIGPFLKTSRAALALEEMERELSQATEITSLTNSRHVEFLVPDRTGDGQSDRIRYQWSGVAGAPLERVFNNQTPVPLIPSAQTLTLAGETLTRTATVPGQVTLTSGTMPWWSVTTGLLENQFEVTSSRLIGFNLDPELPTHCTQWTLSAVDIKASRKGTVDGTCEVRVWSANMMRLPGTLLATQSIPEASFPSSSNWFTINFQPPVSASPGQVLCVTFHAIAGTDAAVQITQDSLLSGTMTGRGAKLVSLNGGTWAVSLTENVLLRTRGTYSIPGTGLVTEQRTRFTRLHVGVQPDQATSDMMQTSVPLRNLPGVAP